MRFARLFFAASRAAFPGKGEAALRGYVGICRPSVWGALSGCARRGYAGRRFEALRVRPAWGRGMFGGLIGRIAGARLFLFLMRKLDRARMRFRLGAQRCAKKRRSAMVAGRPELNLISGYTADSFPEIIRHIATIAAMTRTAAPNASRLVNARLFCWRDAHI